MGCTTLMELLAVVAACAVASATAEGSAGAEVEREALVRDDECTAPAGAHGCLSLAQLRGRVLTADADEDVAEHLENQTFDKCVKHSWPDLADPCSLENGFFDSCEARIRNLASKYGGSCGRYCSSIGFQCSSGTVPHAGVKGCPKDSDKGTYFSCEEETQSEEAVCKCSDAMLTSIWSGKAELCGPGRVLVKSGTCKEYCGSQGLSCKSAHSASGSGCSAGAHLGCSTSFSGPGAVCECSGSFDMMGAFKWPDKKELCESSTVLVSGKVLQRNGGSCAGYCKSLYNRVPGVENTMYWCYGAWRAVGNVGCSASRQDSSRDACDTNMEGHDAVCACSFPTL